MCMSVAARPHPCHRIAVPDRPAPRLRLAVRDEVQSWSSAIDQMLTPDHPARAVWDFAQGIDLWHLYRPIKATQHRPGHPHVDPRILFALWLYATIDGVGSARELDRLCTCHTAYQWLCGGVSMNYHTLADFRVDHHDWLNELLTNSVAVLLHQDLVTLNRVAQDGMKVRVSAGADTFRRQPTLERRLAQAREQVDRIARRYGRAPREMLVDAGFGSLEDIDHLKQAHGTTTYAPVKNEKKLKEQGENPYAPREGDTAAVVEWRQRMGTESAQAIYKQRSSSAEWVNAGCRNRGLYQLVVRGVEKVRCCALWQALAHNVMVMWRVATRQRQNPVAADDSRQ